MEIESKEIHYKRGYLDKDFQFFHLKDNKNIQFEFHYHDFNKIIIFISGKVTYLIEGKTYKLKPWDILLVNNNEIHKPMIDQGETYERIVIWVNSAFLLQHSDSECNLQKCFELAAEKKLNLLRLAPDLLIGIKGILSQLEDSCKSHEFGSKVLKNSLFLQYIVQLNRLYLGIDIDTEYPDIEYDETIGRILEYINTNLKEDLSMDNLASIFYLSKYYLMRKFKQQTGYTVHNYILQKRLIAANALIKRGKSITTTCIECGFGDYSNFVRSFKKSFGLSPKKHYKLFLEQEKLANQHHRLHQPNITDL
ncbi:AraC family transcriptional regulator [Pelosinus fermentans]|uniref:Transcriptional regulator, AraC family n=1 Tax=Pelosinus fermentans JBW45 TaxID=1192197 RepID=I9NQH6_9FIRM|nr:AraC family transcriptional regulator [Pelosinus fermentans]AJQ28289.1 transcriptional regulator, AraC family [Pelosinus fermentans JBW45]